MKHWSVAGTSTQGLNGVNIVEDEQPQRRAGELKSCGIASGPAITTAEAAHWCGMTLEMVDAVGTMTRKTGEMPATFKVINLIIARMTYRQYGKTADGLRSFEPWEKSR